ncbi:hypothetical protein, partial [Kitasatospora sp. MBT63]|uniref:hypothetical protein n=1 Tax=Kitasatospora sp. MBT63 TaxID=1444768 RepID=UPI00053B165C
RIISAQVTVTRPDLEVGHLAVGGDMQIAGKLLTHQVVAYGAAGFWLNTRAETDGILVATVERGDAYVDVGRGQYFLTSLAPGHCGFVSLPVLKGARIRYKINTGADAKIDWYGFGPTPLPSPWP